MTPPDEKPSAHRPLLDRKGAKRALVNVGGAVEAVGDEDLAKRLTEALTVRPGERDATLTHPFHAYPARLHPAVARSLLATLVPAPGAAVLDPFCGSGTVLVEALVAGHRPLGRDLSPLATELAGIKTLVTTVAERKAIGNATRRVANRADEMVRQRVKCPVPAGEERWFSLHTLREVAALAKEINRAEGVARHAMRMLLSSVLVKVSLQVSDSDARNAPKDVLPGTAVRLFEFKELELDRCLTALSRATPRDAAGRAARVEINTDDAGELRTVPPGSVDAIVTSPPYANHYDYLDHHARRYAWLGLDATRMAAREIGAARWFEDPEAGALRFRRELGSMCAAFARVLKPGARAAVVIADGAAGDRAVRADRLLREAAEAVGMRVIARASQERKTFDEDSAAAFAKSPKREHVIVIGRP